MSLRRPATIIASAAWSASVTGLLSALVRVAEVAGIDAHDLARSIAGEGGAGVAQGGGSGRVVDIGAATL